MPFANRRGPLWTGIQWGALSAAGEIMASEGAQAGRCAYALVLAEWFEREWPRVLAENGAAFWALYEGPALGYIRLEAMIDA